MSLQKYYYVSSQGADQTPLEAYVIYDIVTIYLPELWKKSKFLNQQATRIFDKGRWA